MDEEVRHISRNLPCISPISPVYLPYISRDMDEEARHISRISPADLQYISVYLPYISATSHVHLAQVRQFFEVAVSAAVLPVFGFPEAGSLYLPYTSPT